MKRLRRLLSDTYRLEVVWSAEHVKRVTAVHGLVEDRERHGEEIRNETFVSKAYNN
jgi:hypothetical protein